LFLVLAWVISGASKLPHDSLIAAAHRAQADALDIAAPAKRRVADEYDGAQKRGEVARPSNPNCSKRNCRDWIKSA
jgi:hypothetical protein